MTQPTLDAQMLAELKELLAESFNELVDRYIEDSTKRFQLLNSAVAANDYKVIYHEAHGIKGSSANVGATHLALLCGKLEALGQSQNPQGVSDLLTQAQAEFQEVCSYLSAQRV